MRSKELESAPKKFGALERGAERTPDKTGAEQTLVSTGLSNHLYCAVSEP